MFDRTLTLLIDGLCTFFTALFVLRVLMRLVQITALNSLAQGVIQFTNPPLAPLARVLKPVRRIDVAALLVAYVLQLVGQGLRGLVVGYVPPPAALMVLAAVNLIGIALMVFNIALLVRVVLSFMRDSGGDLGYVSYRLTEPVLAPIRRLLPPLGGFDLSPLVAFFAGSILLSLCWELALVLIGPL